MDKVAYLGPDGSYSRIAAEKFRPQAEYSGYTSFGLVIKALLNGECNLAVLPIENSLNGGVNQNIDLLQSTDGLIAFEELTVEIDHRLATREGADLSEITRIFSHRQALEQCGEYLSEHFPSAKLMGAPSTAAGLDMLEYDTDACIVGAHTVRKGITLSPFNIADEKSNYTHFLLIKKGGVEDCKPSEKIYFSAACLHKPGELLHMLAIIADGGLNMTKIESRPIKDSPGEYRFFIEVEGNCHSESVKAVLKRVERSSKFFKILGVY